MTYLFYNAMLADAVALTITISLLIGICNGIINLLGILFGGLGIFLSRRTMAIIGLVLNLSVLVGTFLVLA